MAKLIYDKQVTALLVIDPYNDFISEGGKVWNRLKPVAEAKWLRAAYVAGAECVTKCGRSRLLCVTSPVPPGGLRDVEVHSAYSTGSLGA
jgi:hypothetical protein